MLFVLVECYIGQIGIGKERSSYIPWEVIDENGLVCTDQEKVFDHWKGDFQGLLNPHCDLQTDEHAAETMVTP